MLPLGTPVNVTPLKSEIDPAVIDSIVSASVQLGPFFPLSKTVSYLTVAVAPGLRWVPGAVSVAVDAEAGLLLDELLWVTAACIIVDVLALVGGSADEVLALLVAAELWVGSAHAARMHVVPHASTVPRRVRTRFDRLVIRSPFFRRLGAGARADIRCLRRP
jgi:hypothetical protein